MLSAAGGGEPDLLLRAQGLQVVVQLDDRGGRGDQAVDPAFLIEQRAHQVT